MEIGQILHQNPVLQECPDYVKALLEYIRNEIDRVYWNVNQRKWAGSPDHDPWLHDNREYDTGIPGIHWQPYYNWGGCPGDDDWDQTRAERPNFKFGDAEFRWYKYFGRSMNVNQNWSPDQWVRWFELCIEEIRVFDNRKNEITMEESLCSGNVPRYCDPCGKAFNYPAQRCGYCGKKLTERVLQKGAELRLS